MAHDAHDAMMEFAGVMDRLFSDCVDRLTVLVDAFRASTELTSIANLSLGQPGELLVFSNEKGRQFLILGHVEGSAIDYNESELLVLLATDLVLCQLLMSQIAETTRDKSQHMLLMTKVQNIAFRSIFLKHYAQFCCEHMRTRSGADTFRPNQECAEVHFGNFQNESLCMAPLIVDKEAVGAVVQKLRFPVTPAVIGHVLGQEARQLNGVWMTEKMHEAFTNFFAELQARGLARSA